MFTGLHKTPEIGRKSRGLFRGSYFAADYFAINRGEMKAEVFVILNINTQRSPKKR